MGDIFIRAAVGALASMVHNREWSGLIMKTFYREQLVRLANGSIVPNWSAVLMVYVLLGTGIATFITSHAATISSTAALGALFGLVAYGVYDFTNYSTLRQKPLVLTLPDLSWGILAIRTIAR